MSRALAGWRRVLMVLAALAVSLAGCGAPAPGGVFPPTRTPFQPNPATDTPLPGDAPVSTRLPPPNAVLPMTAASTGALPSSVTPPPLTPGVLPVWLDPALPDEVVAALGLPAGYTSARRVTDPAQAALRISLNSPFPQSQPAGYWVYALAAAFPTLQAAASLDDLLAAWQGRGETPLLLDEAVAAVFAARWGPPGQGALRILPAAGLLDAAWVRRPAWAILPFDRLEPRWKVLAVDGRSPLRKDFDPAADPLSIPLYLDASPAARLDGLAAPTNRDPAGLTVLAMTGVTALVRATAHTIERQGVNYPAKDVGPLLRAADLTHISNEVPFARDCPFPNPVQPDMRFCSDPAYLNLLEEVGTDIVELTGDHFQDWGVEAMRYTLKLYRQEGWGYYGGGEDLEDARRPLLIEHHGNRLAFVGCNAKGGGYAQAGPNHPGAAACDLDFLADQIRRLRADGYLVIATFQHFEYYSYRAQPDQERDFRRLARAGAAVVSGSQAHQPQAFEFEEGAFIHYGLGNLFFDQYDVSQACREALIDYHVFYNGRYLGVELQPILFVDYARPRLMNPKEARSLLDTLFQASGW